MRAQIDSRRQLLVLAMLPAFLFFPFAVPAQQKMRRVGILLPGTAESEAWRVSAFKEGLRAHGYKEDKNVTVETRFGNGQPSRLPELAAQLAALGVEVIFAGAVDATIASKQHAPGIPVVFMGVGNPVELGLVSSLARPGGMLTGLSPMSIELAAKRLELLKEISPAISRVAMLFSGDINSMTRAQTASEVERAAKALGMEVRAIEFNGREDSDRVSTQLRQWRADSLYAVTSARYIQNRLSLSELAANNQLPMVASAGRIAEVGALVSYGIYAPATAKRAAAYVDKILRGSRPGDLPVEQPMQLELVVNLKTAKALGIAIPHTIMLRADRIIQ